MGGGAQDRIRFNVGGKIFETTSTTLANAGRDSFFGALFDDEWNLKSHNTGRDYFIDRNPTCFAVLLDLLRTGELCIPQNLPERLLYREADFYGLTDHVRAAKWGPFDGNRLNLSTSVSGRAPGDGTAIRGGPDGGCCVAHGSMVHVYDWMMEQHAPITLDYRTVYDVGWIDAESIVVGVGGGEGMGLFNATSGELRHRFQVSHKNLVTSFTSVALTFSNSDGRIFSSCRGRTNEYGIGVWDRVTGEQMDFFYEPDKWSFGEAGRLQWLDGTNCLLVATFPPRRDYCYISLLDFRVKKMVWSWSDIGNDRGGTPPVEGNRVRDAIALEENSSICVVSEDPKLGFIDLRSSGGFNFIRWSFRRTSLMQGKMPDHDEPCYPKLALHNGQLFFSMNDCISVFCGSDWVLTSRLRRSSGGPICDISIGGDRLFALHSEDNVFDVWETSPSRFSL
ncbi:hypothetical protein Dimus_034251 [Dionaea muscipula]